MCKIIYIFIVFTLVLYINGNVLKNSDLFRLDIIHYNDFHASFEEVSLSDGVCVSNDVRCLGGFARLYYEVKELLRTKPGALVLNAGDTFQGTYWYTLMKWNVTQKFINLLPNDAHALGNHEFDGGVPGLVPYIRALRAPVVAANLETSAQSELHGLYQPNVVLERGGRKIGIIGLTTEKTGQLSNSDGVKFLNPITVARQQAKNLTDQGIDIIIILSHCGLQTEIEIAKEAGDDIDIIVGGHSHSLLWNGHPPSNETVSGTYPVVVESTTKPGHKVVIVTASSITKYVGNFTAYFDQQGQLQGYDGIPVFLNRSIPEDPEVKALLKPYADELHHIVNDIVGYTNGELEKDSCAVQECALADIIVDSYVDAAKEKYPSTLPYISFMVRSMMRSGISKGNITIGSVINMTPFTNKVVTFTMKGKYLVQALALAYNKNNIGQYFAHFSGLKLKVNSTTGEVIDPTVKDGDQFVPLDPEKEYQIVTLSYLTSSGIFDTFKENKSQQTVLGTDYELIVQYIRKITPITPKIDHRLEFV